MTANGKSVAVVSGLLATKVQEETKININTKPTKDNFNPEL